MTNPAVPPPTVLELAAAVTRIEHRLAALEGNLTSVAEDILDPAEVDRLAWFMKHGRRRPW